MFSWADVVLEAGTINLNDVKLEAPLVWIQADTL